MMEYLVSDLEKEIRIVLDENSDSDALSDYSNVDTLSLNDIVRSKIEDAAVSVVRAAPIHLIGTGKPFGDSIGWDMAVGYGSGHILLPNDFLRLIVFQMSDWSMPVIEPITVDDPRYAMQRSRYPGVRGNPQKPVVAIVQQPIGTVLEFYSCEQGDNVYIKMARYAPIPKIYKNTEHKDAIKITQQLKRAVVYYAAYLTALSVQDVEHANSFLAISKSLIDNG